MTLLNNTNFTKALKNACKLFDLYSQNVNLYISKKPKFNSTFSGIISLGVIFLIGFAFSQFLISWINGSKMTIIPSAISWSISEILAKNMTISFDFDYQNYYVYFVVTAYLPNGTTLLTKDLEKFVSYNFTYFTTDGNYELLQPDACRMQYEDVFLGFDQEKIKSDVGISKKNRICIKEPFQMGLYPDIPTKQVKQPEFYFSVYTCENSTENNNSCASNQEIDEMLKYIQIQTSIPTTIYNFQNTGKPQSNFYDYQNIQLDKSLVKYYQNSLIPTYLYTDYGLITEDYQLMETNFNPRIFYDPKVRKNRDPLFIFDFIVGQNFQIYYQRNQKINEIIGSLGGLLNAILLIGKIICYTYNSIYLRFKIIKATFSIPRKIETIGNSFSKGRENLTNSAFLRLQISKKFSYFKYLFPTKEVRTFYQRGSNRLHEYLDIRNIIKRLQDVDKLKMVVLNENQRKMFEIIPKPDLADTSYQSSQSTMLKYKKSSKIKPNIQNFIQNGVEKDPVSQRLFTFLQPDNETQPKGNLYLIIIHI